MAMKRPVTFCKGIVLPIAYSAALPPNEYRNNAVENQMHMTSLKGFCYIFLKFDGLHMAHTVGHKRDIK